MPAAAAPPPAVPSNVPLDFTALLAAQPRWLISTSVETSFGYRDNLLLSHARPEKSGFGQSIVDAMLWRLPRGRTDYIAYLSALGRYYFEGKEVDHEANVGLLSEWRYRIPDTLNFALSTRGFYADQVLDISDTETRRVVSALEGNGIAGGPMLRWEFHRAWWIEGKAEAGKERYRGGTNDNRNRQFSLGLAWHRGERVEIRAGGTERRRDFARRRQYTATGRELDNTQLAITEREGALRIHVGWDANKHWETTTTATVLDYADNGTGYLNYRERKIAQELEWTSGDWRVELEGSAAREEFQEQTVGFGFAPPRIEEEFTAHVLLERKLSERWTIFCRYRWERARSNEEFASYRLNEGLLGARWSWEK